MIEKSKPFREQAYELLKDMIVEGKILPNSRIVETEYATKFNISRTPVREAIRMLELEGLVEIGGKGGARVCEITPNDIIEVYKIRNALENIIVEELIENDTNLMPLKDILENTDLKGDTSSIIQSFKDFNTNFYGLTKYTRIAKMINDINLYLRRFRKISLMNAKRRETAYKEHIGLVDAIEKKDLKRALEINKIHLESGRDYLLSQINKK